MADLARLLLDHTDPLGAAVLVGNDNPLTVAGGVNASIGSLYVSRATGGLFRKIGAAATAWVTVGSALNVVDFTAVGDGTTDARAAFVATDAVGALFVPPGTYRIASAVTITNAITFAPGAILKPDSGVTVTIDGPVTAGLYQIFDMTAGGFVVFGSTTFGVRGQRDVPAAWFGQIVGELHPTHDAIQWALDALPVEGGDVVLASGWNYHRRPIRLRDSFQRLRGSGGYYATHLRGDYFGGGPQIVIAPTLAAVPTTTALATGTGSAFSLVEGSQYWLNLRDALAVEVNGLAAFCAEFFFQPTVASGGNRGILCSQGRRMQSETTNCAFRINHFTTARIQAQLKIGVTTYTLTSANNTVPLATTKHVALTYDGATIRLFVAGVLEATQAVVGTITQARTEDVTLGPELQRWPESNLIQDMTTGSVDSVRISDTARYTAAFTPPTAKFASDSNTLILCNFATQWDQFTKAESKPNAGNGDVWLYLRRNTFTSAVSQCGVEGVTLECVGHTGIMAVNATRMSLRDLKMTPVRGGILLWNNCYLSELSNIYITMSSPSALPRYGIAVLQASGVVRLNHIEVAGGPYPVVIRDSTVELADAFLHGDGTLAHILAVSESSAATLVLVSLDYVTLTDEDIASGLEACVLASEIKLLTIGSGSTLEAALNSVPLIKVDGGKVVALDSSFFRSKVGATEVIQVVTALAFPVQADKCLRLDVAGNITVPWSTTAGAVSDNSHGNEQARRSLRVPATVTYSASMTPDATFEEHRITATNNTAFTINAPTNLVANQWVEIALLNTSGGALGAATWAAAYKMAAWTNPATGFQRAIRFWSDGTSLFERERTTADVPN